MKPFAIALLIAGAVWAQDQDKQKADPGPKAGIAIKIGWDGDLPPGAEAWDDVARAKHEAAMSEAKAEIAEYIAAAHAQRLDTHWDVDAGFGLYRRSVNAGFSAGVSMDIVKGFIVDDAKRDDAERALKTTATEETAAEKDNTNAADKEKEFRNLGQWVKAQVHSGLHGEELADAIHKRIKERHDQKMADKAAGKDSDANGDDGSGQDHGKGDDGSHGRGNGGGDDHGQGHGEGHGHGHGPK